MQKLIAREFLWLLFALVFAIPLGLAFLWLLGHTDEMPNMSEHDQDYIVFLYIIGYVVSFIGIYLIRFIMMALRVLADRE